MTESEKIFGAALVGRISALAGEKVSPVAATTIHNFLTKFVPCEGLAFYSYLQEEDGRIVLYAGCDWGGFRGTARPVYDSVKGWL